MQVTALERRLPQPAVSRNFPRPVTSLLINSDDRLCRVKFFLQLKLEEVKNILAARFLSCLLQRWMAWQLGTEKEYTELLTGASHRIDEVEGLRILRANHSFVGGSHVHHLSSSALLCLRITSSSRDNACSGGHRLHEFQNRTVPLGSLASNGEPGFSSVAVHGPDGNGEERERGGSVRSVLVALQGYPQQAVLHLLGQGMRGHGEFQHHQRRATGVFLDAEADAPLPVPEDGASDRVLWQGRQPRSRQDVYQFRGRGAGH